MKKIIAIFLSAIMLAGCFALTALAEMPSADLSDAVETEEGASEEDAEETEDAGSDLELTLVSRATAPVGAVAATAVQASFGKTYTKGWTKYNDDQNQYAKFTLSQRGIVTLKTNKPLDSDGDVGKLDLTFYDGQGNKIYANACYKAVDDANFNYVVRCGLEAGTYYIGISPGFVVVSGTIEVSFSLSFQANAYCETESNDGPEVADSLTLGKMYTAYFGTDGSTDTEEADYFRFSAVAGHNYRITFENFGVMEPTTTMIKIIGDKSGDIVSNLKQNVDDQGRNYFVMNALATRDYYVVVHNYSKSQYTYGVMVEDVTSTSHVHQYAALVTAPTCVAQGYTTNVCECGDRYVDAYVDATGNHDYDNGKDTTCNTCGYVRKISNITGGTAAVNAVNVTLGSWYHHGWTKNNDSRVHYAKFTINQQGIVTVKVSKPFDDFGEVCKYDFTIYDANSMPVFGNDCYHSVNNAKSHYEIKCGLPAGTYFICMDPTFIVKSGTIDMEYTVLLQPTQYCETESNEAAAHADKLVLDQMYTGYLGSDGSDYEENDYYRYDAVAGHTYRITIKNLIALNGTTALINHNGGKESYISTQMESKVDANGYHYWEFKATETRTNYVYLDNYSREQIQYGIMVSDVTNGTHTHSYTSKVVAGTCVSEGYTLYTCDCGESYKGDFTAMGSHVVDVTPGYAAGCTTSGLTDGKKCSACGTVLAVQETIPATGHVWDKGTVTKKPTLEETGIRTFTCSACQMTREETIPVLSALRIPGDVNDDSVVNIMDALLTLQYSVGWDVDINLLNADVDVSDTVTIMDALLILQYSVGWDIDLL